MRLRLSLDECADEDKLLASGERLYRTLAEWQERVAEFAIHELLPLKNRAWIDDDEQEVTPEEFRARMTLTGITLYADGSFDFYHQDGGLFDGHCILVSGSIEKGPTHAHIPGLILAMTVGVNG